MIIEAARSGGRQLRLRYIAPFISAISPGPILKHFRNSVNQNLITRKLALLDAPTAGSHFAGCSEALAPPLCVDIIGLNVQLAALFPSCSQIKNNLQKVVVLNSLNLSFSVNSVLQARSSTVHPQLQYRWIQIVYVHVGILCKGQQLRLDFSFPRGLDLLQHYPVKLILCQPALT